MTINKLIKEFADTIDERYPAGGPEDYYGQMNEFRLAFIIKTAVETADLLIMEGSDGSIEETDYLTSAVAKAFMEKVHGAMQSKWLRKQLEERAKK